MLMKDSKMEDISDPNNPILVFEHKDMVITNTTWRYPNVFTSNRFKKARLRVFDTKKYKWTFRFTYPGVKLFVKLNFNFINYTLMSQEVRDNFQFNVTVDVSPYRKCHLTSQSDDKWRDNGRKTDSAFICDSISPEAHKLDIKNPSDYMIMETQASHDIPHDFIALFFGKSYGTEEEPLCGEPEISLSVSSRFNVQYKDYSISCKPDKYNYISAKNDIIPETSLHGMKCGRDMIWYGSLALCTPKKPCSIDELSNETRTHKTAINSLEGLYFFNESQYYAIERTEVTYGCENSLLDIMVGKENRVCLKNGSWTGMEPYCYSKYMSIVFSINKKLILTNISDPNESTKFPGIQVLRNNFDFL